MISNTIKQITELILELKTKKEITVEDKKTIQKLQQLLDEYYD